MNREFDLLRVAIQNATRVTFKNLLETHQDEQFYVFALYTDDSLTSIYAAANSEEGYQKQVDKNKEVWSKLGIADFKSIRWTIVEWAYDYVGKENFQDVNNLLCQVSKNKFQNDNESPTSKEQVLDTMIVALRNLDREGLFGVGEDRKKVTVFASTSDSDQGFEAENDSARALNPDPVFQSFIARYE